MAKKKKQFLGLKCTETNKINYTIEKPLSWKDVKDKKVMKYCKELGKHTVHIPVKLG